MGEFSKPLHLNATLSAVNGINGQLSSPQSISGTLQKGAIGAAYVYYDTTENWNLKGRAISERGGIYVYSDYSSKIEQGRLRYIPAIKVGDGTNHIADLPFVTDLFIVTDYDALENKPLINDVPLVSGNNELEDLGIAKASNRDISKLFT